MAMSMAERQADPREAEAWGVMVQVKRDVADVVEEAIPAIERMLESGVVTEADAELLEDLLTLGKDFAGAKAVLQELQDRRRS